MAVTYGYEISGVGYELDVEFSTDNGVNVGIFSKLGDAYEISGVGYEFDVEFATALGDYTGIFSKLGDGYEISGVGYEFDIKFSEGNKINDDSNNYIVEHSIGADINVIGKFYDYSDNMFEIIMDDFLRITKKSRIIPII